ncbi:MAG: TIGR02302 family protein [Paracoccaceae bacterium]
MIPYGTPARGFTPTLGRAIRRSRRALWAERLARALWPAFTVFCLAAAAVLFGIVDLLGPVAHRVALGGLGLAVVAALVVGFRGFRVPARDEALARLDASDPARPLGALTDRLAAGKGTPTAQALWRAHLARAEAAAAGLSARAPDLKLSTRDRWALRLFAPVLLAAGFVAAGEDWLDRLGGSVAPGPAERTAVVGTLAPRVEGWAVPPAYTGETTVYLNELVEERRPIDLPQGSELTIRATGLETEPALSGDGLGGLEAFVSLGGGLFEATAVLETSGRVVVTADDRVLADWGINVIPDAAPTVQLDGAPRSTATRALELAFTATDDHGVVSAWAEIVLAEPGEERLEVDPIEFGLPLPISGDPRSVSDTAVRDLTEHPWAGAEVLLTLRAEDGAGQVAATEPVRFRLPERRFTDPLARALVDQRRDLIVDYAKAERVLDAVQAVTRWPEEVFDEHVGAYLGVRMAVRRLAHAIVDERVTETAPDVAEILWRAALSLEAGDLASALERLREAADRLREALESGSEQDIRDAIDGLRQAMSDYLQQLAEQARQNPDMLSEMPDGGSVSQQDLDALLDQLQNQAEAGLRDQAQQMLSQLQQMLENLQAGRSMQPGEGSGQQALQQLQEMIQRQRQLSDDTFDQLRQQQRQGQQGQPGQPGQQPGQQGQPGQQPGQGQMGRQGQQPGQGQTGQQGQGGQRSGRHSESGRLAAEQEALRRAIDELRDQLGGGEGMDGASRALDDAGRAMGDARDDLQQDAPGSAVQDQMDALDRLQEGAQALAEAVENGQGQQAAQGRNNGTGQAGDTDAIDPFDRPSGAHGAIDGDSTEVPDRALVDRARELLDELRRRSSDKTRPELELDYLERLLERF